MNYVDGSSNCGGKHLRIALKEYRVADRKGSGIIASPKMAQAIRQHRRFPRASERIPLHARLHLTNLDGKPIAPPSLCTRIGLGGLQGSAASGVTPGTRVCVAVQLPSGCVFEARGRVAWARTTLHLALFGTPKGMDDDVLFGIEFDALSPDDLLPIARLFAARDRQRRRARQIRSHRPLPIRA